MAYNNRITSLKATAIIGVILTHLFVPSTLLSRFLWAYAIRLAVPLFLIISGYLLTMSWEHHHESLFTYCRYTLPSRLFSLLPPFVIIVSMEFLLLHYTFQVPLTFIEMCKFFLLGGRGPGNYYVPLIFQIYLIYPLLRFANRSHIFLWGSISFIADYLVHLGIFNLPLSHFICLRYLFFVATGVFCYQKGTEILKNAKGALALKLIFAVGILMIALINFTPYHLSIYVPQASMPVAFFCGPLFIWIVNLPPIHTRTVICKGWLWMGENTWNIFLSQMFLFYIAALFPCQKQLFLSGIIGKFLFFVFIIIFSWLFSLFIAKIQHFCENIVALLHQQSE